VPVCWSSPACSPSSPLASLLLPRRLCTQSVRMAKRSAARVYRYVRYELPELVFPSGFPDPPGTPKPVKLTLIQHGEVRAPAVAG
jgi:hypothetical protein